jgi:glycosyltransferase involved in cell wall biosynthesis
MTFSPLAFLPKGDFNPSSSHSAASFQNILVSVLMPVYNMQNSVLDAVQSILQQSHENFELLVYDDGSTDNTVEKISSIKDPRLVLFKENINQGRPFARNFLLQKAKGKYIAWLDADDLAYPSRLYKQIEYCENNPKCVAVGAFSLVFSSSFNFTKTLVNIPLLLRAQVLLKNPFVFSSLFHKNNPEIQFDNSLLQTQDTDFIWQLSSFGDLACVSSLLCKHIVSEGHHKTLSSSYPYIIEGMKKNLGLPSSFPIQSLAILFREPKKLAFREIDFTLSEFKKILPEITSQYPELKNALESIFCYQVLKCSFLFSPILIKYLILANPIWVYKLYKSRY